MEPRQTFDPKMYMYSSLPPKTEDLPVIQSEPEQQSQEILSPDASYQAPVPYEEVVNANYKFK